jgi:hypothetical protein
LLNDVELPSVERIDNGAFLSCRRLRRIAIPLENNNMFPTDEYQQYLHFDGCENLAVVDLVGGIRNTIASLLLECWKNEMNQEIDLINQDLLNTSAKRKTNAIRLWIRSVIDRIEHFKAEHYALLKEDMTQLELAIWNAKLMRKRGMTLVI